jgi:hypothetical protein
MPKSIGKLPNVNLHFALQFNDIHFVLNLVIDKLKDAIFILNLFYQRDKGSFMPFIRTPDPE